MKWCIAMIWCWSLKPAAPDYRISYARGGADHLKHRRQAGGSVQVPPASDRRLGGYCLVEPTCGTVGGNPATNHIG